MNINSQIYDSYKKATVETVAPGKLLLMLFDGAILNIDNAKKAIGAKYVNTAHTLIIKTENIILELMGSLKSEYEISQSLYNLYEYLYYQLVQANARKDIAKLDEVRGFLVEFRETWEQAMKKLSASALEKSQTPLKKTLNIKG